MRYTLKDMQKQFPSDEACLQMIFESRYGHLKACPKCGVVSPKYYRIKKRMAYECKDCGNQLYPLVGTIFEKTTTPLTDWFHAIYLVSVAKNGISAKEIERQVAVSYKTAHRMAKQIRRLMGEHGMLGGLGTPIEMDEVYIGGRKKQSSGDKKTPVLAAVEVKGQIRTQVVERANSQTALSFLAKYVRNGSMLHTDESKIYKHKQVKQYYQHGSVRHIANEFLKDGVTTNHVENFFGQLKRSLDGTFHAVSPYYLHLYVSEFAYRYNHRREAIFPLLVAKAATTIE
jgi:transposase-like protein